MPYFQHLLIIISIFAISVLSLNLVVGYTGILSVMQAGLQGIGSYTLALLLVQYGWGFIPALIVAVLITAAFALPIGFILSRLRGDYFALGSLGVNAIITAFLINAMSLTNGPLGIARIPFPKVAGLTFATVPGFMWLVLGALFLVLGFCFWITRSSFGLVLRAIREDEDAIQIFGYRVRWYKLTIFVMSAGLAAFSGAFYASYIRFIDPTPFNINASVNILAAAILGGLGRLRGSLIGAVLFIGLNEAVRFLGFDPSFAAQFRLGIVGILLIVLMIVRPQGILGSYKLK